MDGEGLGVSARAVRGCIAGILIFAGLAIVRPAPAPAQIPSAAPAWTQPRYDAANTGHNPTERWLSAGNVASLALDWQATVAQWISPIVAGGVVYLGCDEGSFCAIDATNGSPRWKTFVAPGEPPLTAALVDNVLYVGGGSEPVMLLALDPASGNVIWKTLVSNGKSSFTTAITATGGLVFQGLGSHLFAWDARTGMQRWVVPSRGRFAVANGVVYLMTEYAAPAHLLFALRASDGQTLWKGSPPAGNSHQTPLVTDGLVIVSSDKGPYSGLGQVAAYPAGGCGAAVCSPVWTRDVDAEPQNDPAAVGGVVYQGFRDGTYLALQASSGQPLWRATVAGPTPVLPGAGSATVANGLLFGATAGFVRAWPAAGCGSPVCQPLWSAPLTAGTWTSADLVVARGRLYVVDHAEVLRVFSPRQVPPPADTPPPVPGPVDPGPARTQPATLRVPGDYPGVQRAIDASIPGDTVLVAPGVYHERLDFHGHAVDVRGSGGPDVTVIDGDGVSTVVLFVSGETRASTLRGFTIRSGSGAGAGGGAINVRGASPSVIGNVLAGPMGGGNGIYAKGGGPRIVGNQIRDNDAGTSAVWLVSTTGAELSDNLIERNAGGGIAALDSDSFTITGNVIRRNAASAIGGGIYVDHGSHGLVAQNAVVENSGGIAMSGRVRLLGNTIAGNTSSPAVLVFDQSAGTAVTGNIISGVPGTRVISCSVSPEVPLDTNIVYNGDDPPSARGASYPSSGCGAQVTSVDPRFVNPRTGDYRVGQGSPAIDAGVSAELLPATDLAGAPRVVDGDGDGTATVDAGAYEAQPPVPPVAGGDGFNPVTPARILDTRSGLGAPAQRLGQGTTIELQVTGRGGVPSAGVSSVVLNVTVTEATATSYLTAWPAGVAQPLASNLNYAASQTVPNLVTVRVGDGGRIRLYNNMGSAHVVADVAGWYGHTGGSQYTPVPPSRILDTRTGNGAPPARIGPASTLSLQVAGRGGVPATGVSAVALNVTATEPTATSFITAWPAGQTRPLASNLNVVAGQTVPNLVMVKVGDGGKVDLYNHDGSGHLIADVAGWFGDGAESAFHGLTPARILDTRTGLGASPVKAGPSSTIPLRATGLGGVPATGVSAVVLNVTVTEPTAGSFLTVWPHATPKPLTSNLNYVAGLTVPNLVVVKVNEDGFIDLYNHAGWTHVIADVAGWYG